MDFVERFVRAFFDRIHRSTSLNTKQLGVYRILVGFFLLFVYLPSYQWLGEVPPALFLPLRFSVVSFASGFPPSWVLLIMDVLMVVAAGCLTVGIRSRMAAAAFALVFLVGSSFSFGFGKIDHFSLFFFTFVCFSTSNWGYRYAHRSESYRRLEWVGPAVLSLLLCFGMLTAGYYKLRGWVDFDIKTSGVLNWYYTSIFLNNGLLLRGELLFLPTVVTEAMDYATVAFELLPLPALLAGPRYWKAWITLACLFHLGTTICLGIDFRVHMIVYLPFILPKIGRSFPGYKLKEVLRVIVLLLCLFHIGCRAWGSPVASLLDSLCQLIGGIGPLWVSIGLWGALFMLGTLQMIRYVPNRPADGLR